MPRSLQHPPTRAPRWAIWLLGATSLLSVGACTHQGPLRDDLGHGISVERKILRGMGMADVRAEQRQAILAAYDRINPRLRTLAELRQQAEKQWQQLNAGEADFAERSAALITQRLALLRETWELETGFDQHVAATLDEQQWATWYAYVRERTHASSANGADSGRQNPEGRRR